MVRAAPGRRAGLVTGLGRRMTGHRALARAGAAATAEARLRPAGSRALEPDGTGHVAGRRIQVAPTAQTPAVRRPPTGRCAASSLANAWPPGFQATEQEVADHLQMSRTPVREAMMRLQQEGLVSVVPRHGLKVLPVSPRRHARDLRDPHLPGGDRRGAGGGPQAFACRPGAPRGRDGGDGASPRDRRPRGLGRGRRAVPRGAARPVRQPQAQGGGPELPGPRPPGEDDHASAAAQARRLDPGARGPARGDPDGDAVTARAVHHAHRERAGRELLALLERLGLNQL